MILRWRGIPFCGWLKPKETPWTRIEGSLFYFNIEGKLSGDRRKQLRRKRDQGPQGSRSRPHASRHVHWHHERDGSSPPGVGDCRQLRGRGHGRVLQQDSCHGPSGQLHHRRGQRPRHPRRHASHREEADPRGRAHHPARRRQVRQQRVQGVRRPARRRRVRCKCALEEADCAGKARWQDL